MRVDEARMKPVEFAENLDEFLSPRSFALIGVSGTPGRPGYSLFKKVRATPEWQDFMKSGAFNTTFLTGAAEYATLPCQVQRSSAVTPMLGSTVPVRVRASTGSARTVVRPAQLPHPFALSVSKGERQFSEWPI